jgi:hypothetical protein
MIERSYQEGVKQGCSFSLGTSFGIWASADLLPVQGNNGAQRQSTSAASWNFAQLESQIFTPRLDYVAEALKSQTVVDQIKRSKFNFRKRLYMVVGVRIARGAGKSAQTSRSFGLSAGIGIDPAFLGGLPITAGVEGSFDRSAAQTESFQGSSDFVYAYRLFEIYYGKQVSYRPYTGGETYDLEGCGADSDVEMDDGDDQAEEEIRIAVEGISGSDYAGDGKLRRVDLTGFELGSDEEYYILD